MYTYTPLLSIVIYSNLILSIGNCISRLLSRENNDIDDPFSTPSPARSLSVSKEREAVVRHCTQSGDD